MPVLPDEESRMVFPRVSFLSRMPPRIIDKAARSLTLPPGLANSALARSSTGDFSPSQKRKRSSRRSGVLPINSITDEPSLDLTAMHSAHQETSDFRTGKLRRRKLLLG